MKQIFVGSSSAARLHAQKICDVLNTFPGIDSLFWRDAFPPGLLTFEALEQIVSTCSGAVLLATPDLHGSPNENVMLEFGLLAGRIGRSNVALCKLGKVSFPSDLLALTYVDFGDEYKAGQLRRISPEDRKKLKAWATKLPTGTPLTQIVRGYTGRWIANLDVRKWRGMAIRQQDIAKMQVEFHLIIPPTGLSGFGQSQGEVFLRFKARPKLPAYEARLLHCASISDVDCSPHGDITFLGRTFSRKLVQEKGKPRGERLAEETIRPGDYYWHLHPYAKQPLKFKVSVKTEDDWTQGSGEARMEPEPFR